ncbi:Gti1/Pac2 family-domain-containing protein [Neocallimastix sp. 'constans']
METFYGIIETTSDALILFEASHLGIVQKVRRRLHEKERKELRSGSCYIFSESESGIKRWTDGRLWSPSRILGNFLIYREVEKKISKKNLKSTDKLFEGVPSKLTAKGSKGAYVFKEKGLLKKTISAIMNNQQHHLVCYVGINIF